MHTNTTCPRCQGPVGASPREPDGKPPACPRCEPAAASPWWLPEPSAPAEAPWWLAGPAETGTVLASSPAPAEAPPVLVSPPAPEEVPAAAVAPPAAEVPWFASPPVPLEAPPEATEPASPTPAPPTEPAVVPAPPPPARRQVVAFACLAAGVLCAVALGFGLGLLPLPGAEEGEAPQAVAKGKDGSPPPEAVAVPGKGAPAEVTPKDPAPPKKGPEADKPPPPAKGPPDAEALPRPLPPDPAGPPEPPERPVRKAPPDPAGPPEPPGPRAKAGAGEPKAAPDPRLEEWLEELKSPLKAKRLAALRAVGNWGAAARGALPALSAHLRHKDKDLADQAARALAQVGAAAVPELLKALDDPALSPRALWALAVIGPEARAAAGPVSELLKDRDPKVRALAARALGEMGPEVHELAPLLAQALRDPDAQVRWRAAEALHEIGPEMASHLLPLLKDKNLALRVGTVRALVLFHESADAIRALTDALRDPQVKVRAAAAAALLRLGPDAKVALPELLECLKGESREVQAQALNTILAAASLQDAALLESVDALNETHDWAALSPPPKRPAPPPKDAIARLTRALADANATRRLAAVLALARLGESAKSALPRLLKSLDDPDRSVKAAAFLATAALDPRRPAHPKQSGALLADALAELQAKKRPDTEKLIRLHILISTVLSGQVGKQAREDLKGPLQAARGWVNKALDEVSFSTWVIPAFVRGVNITAEFRLGFTEPFGRLSLKLQALLQQSKDLVALQYAFAHLGEGVPKASPLAAPLQRNRYHAFTNPFLLDWMILARQQKQLETRLAEKALQMLLLHASQSRVCHVTIITPGSRTHVGGLDRPPPPTVPEHVDPDLVREVEALLQIKTQLTFAKAEELSRKLWSEGGPVLVRKLRDDDPLVRWVAATLIGRKRIHAEKELLERLSDPVPDVRAAVRQALARLARGTDFGPHPLASKGGIRRSVEHWAAWLELQQPGSMPGHAGAGPRTPDPGLPGRDLLPGAKE
jgi:HEAT repeat protein